MSLKNKLKLKNNLKSQIAAEEQKGKDTRYLNFFDLKFDEKIRVLFVPDSNGELWGKMRKHGPRLKTRGVGAVRCLREIGQECPSCNHAFDLNNIFKESGDKEIGAEFKRWFPTDVTVMSCIVLESPIEITPSEGGNEVKLINVPYGIETAIKEAIKEGIVDENSICSTPFFIKKSRGAGDNASYDHSYFDRKEVSDEELDYFEDKVVEFFNYSDDSVLLPFVSQEEAQEWFDAATIKVNAARQKDTGAPEKETTTQVRSAVSSRIQSRAQASQPEPEADDSDSAMTEEERYMGEGEPSDAQEAPEPVPVQRTSSVRDRVLRR